jgi:DNA replication protein DnaC
MRSSRIPRRNHQTDNLLKPQSAHADAKGTPLSVRIARGKPNSSNTRSKTGIAVAIATRFIARFAMASSNRRLQAAMRSSRLPAVKRLTEFDCSFQPSLRREQMESLHELGFVERRENVVFLGPPGVGKTHLAISLAIAAAQSGRRVYYGTLADLIASLEEAQAAGRLQVRFKVLTHPALLVVDEIGYLPISRTGAMLFFQLMTRRYEHASTVLTSNKALKTGAGSLATRSWPLR